MEAYGSKLVDCEVCGTKKAKYTCPKCEVRTCCLACVNIHKKELDCDGIRNRTKYIPLKSFTDLDMLSDYRFLEEINKAIETCRRNPGRKYTREGIDLPVHLHKLRCAATRRKVSLLFMPQHFSRHKTNTTYLNWKTNELYWRTEWIFPQAENTKMSINRVLESTRLSKLVEQLLDPVSSLKDQVDIAELNGKRSLTDKLQFYEAAGLNGIKILLKAEKVKRANSRYYELDFTLTLKENLENKIIIEFPTLYVIMKDHSDMYELVETDEEISDTESKKHIERKKKFTNSRFSNDKNAVNYFFNDFSDDEKTGNELSKTNVHSIKRNKCSSDISIPHYEEL